MKNDTEILDMLAYKRPAGSKTETMFIRKYLDTIPGMKKDTAGNRIIQVGVEPTVLWSCHTDTVHLESGFIQPIRTGDIVSANGEILGADDCAGIWIMREMIKAGKPGLYIFHRGEEIGGIGSSHIARKNPKLLSGIKMAVALDRMGQTDIITHMGERTCSDAFALSLADAMGLPTMKPCSGGVFTDTLNYVGLVPECTNLAVGYVRAHSKHETVNLAWLETMLDALLYLDPALIDCPGFEPEWSDTGYNDFRPGFDANDYLVEHIRQNADKVAQMLADYGLDDEVFNY